MLFDTDRKAMERSDGFAMFGKVVVQEFGPFNRSFGEELSNAIGLGG